MRDSDITAHAETGYDATFNDALDRATDKAVRDLARHWANEAHAAWAEIRNLRVELDHTRTERDTARLEATERSETITRLNRAITRANKGAA